MNDTIETILNHRSIRKFTDKTLTREQIETIIQAAQQASTSSYMMAYSIIGVTDSDKKKELADITGQAYVQHNGHLLIFCADLHHSTVKATESDYQNMLPNLENSEHFLVASVDAALAAQNAAISAESLGLGICFIGSIRNHLKRVDELLHLPNHVIPLFGMVIGEPAHQPEQKPRFPLHAVYFENGYKEHAQSIEAFDQTLQAYYHDRTTNARLDSWSDQMIRKFSVPKRMDVTDLIQSKGFNKR
ncbi:oxygen-insensitive NADPH nitroreductase [Thalassobacillus sp. CUG 92003]|uniref:oxygen-insensitive NADPH nitroreductase n=1 Tax=Thalassobacillus sp. CUG 92003 TaxID=2736641 RepID=UPI0015E6A3AC|nr:oxygen-insensitive NADPH nitroreductase [Thalassobacillus sp. CUG 92003]